jgi:DNA mismatch repair protein MutS2
VDRDKPVDLKSVDTVKLVGMRVDDALGELEKALDRAFLENRPVLAVIHGIGTSALKKAVRAHLKAASYPMTFRSGLDEEGGEAVTVVFFD